jgi:hypothetical protein
VNNNTEGLNQIYSSISEEEKLTENVIHWLIEVKPRGIWTMLGLRTTKGSQDHLGMY